MKTVIVSNDIYGLNTPAGGIATHVRNLCRVLHNAGHPVSILGSQGMPVNIDPTAKVFYDNLGIEVQQIPAPSLEVPSMIAVDQRLRSELVAEYVRSADIVYFHEWQANGYHLIKQKRFASDSFPICITRIAGSTEWINEFSEQYPNIPDDLHLYFMERYAVQYSDHVIIPSQFMLNWFQERHWQLPDEHNIHIMGHPYITTSQYKDIDHASQFKRLIYFARMQTGKGFDIFVDALLEFGLSLEVVFLGADTGNTRISSQLAFTKLREAGYQVTAITDKNSSEAQTYLAEHVSDSLVVMPSLLDSFPHTVIEASLIPGLNYICSNQGGQPDIVGTDTGQLFYPSVADLRRTIETWVAHGPRPHDQLGHYETEVVNQQWIDFHESMIEQARDRQKTVHAVVKPQPENPVIDVIIAYYNHGDYLPDTLLSLAQQSVSYFNVFVIDDGSTDRKSVDVFDDMKSKYPQWTFIRRDNHGLEATRNYAVSLGSADYLLFVDSDDIAAPNFIARYYEAITHSETDCLYCYSYDFVEQTHAKDGSSLTVAPINIYKPFGADLISGVLFNTIGSAQFIVRRTVFDALGGFLPPHRIPWEDYAFLVRLILEGYRYDIVPEVLYYHRYIETSLSHAYPLYRSMLHIQNIFDEQLGTVGMFGLARAFLGLYHQYSEGAVHKQLVEGNKQGQLYIKELEADLKQLKQQVDEQHLREHQPKLKDTLRTLYRFVVPISLRLRLKQQLDKKLTTDNH